MEGFKFLIEKGYHMSFIVVFGGGQISRVIMNSKLLKNVNTLSLQNRKRYASIHTITDEWRVQQFCHPFWFQDTQNLLLLQGGF
jgi:hypothetical protein